MGSNMNSIRNGDAGARGAGQLVRHADFPSRHLAPRHVDVWCPPAASPDSAIRYPVIYMHDGQNLFDPAASFIGVDWGVIEAMSGLMAAGAHPGAIIVGIWNSPLRWREYMPRKPLLTPEAKELLADFSRQAGGEPLSDAYLRLITQELKPFIDERYPTLPDRLHTFVMGSSMGGLISLYALIEYPEILGGAACLSTHWPIGKEFVLNWFGNSLPAPGLHKLYFDYGTETLDHEYETYQIQMNHFISRAGYRPERDWQVRKFQGAEHSERAWRARVHLPLAFLLGIERV